jgi:hypothetical protein
VEYESEASYEESEEDDMIITGKTNRANVEDLEEDEWTKVPEYIAPDAEGESLNSGKLEALNDEAIDGEASKTWADIEIEAAETSAINVVGSLNIGEDFARTVDDTGLFSSSSNSVASDDEDGMLDLADFDFDTNKVIPTVTMTTQADEKIDVSGVEAINTIFAGFLTTTTFDEIFDVEDSNNMPADNNNQTVLDTMDILFKRAMEGTYGNMKDLKDKPVKSVITGHTVDANLENARPIINYLKNWLSTAGHMKEVEYMGDSGNNISKLTSLYLMFESYGVLDSVSPIKQMFNSDSLDLPVELSTLVVVNSMYS